MKLTRILSLAMIGIILAISLCSCGDLNAPIIHVTLKIVADDPDEPILDTQVEVQSNEPTVLEAFQLACIENEISYKLTDAGDSVQDVKDFVDYTDANGIAHYWMYLVNDVEPTIGKAGANAIADGDVIYYTYVSFDPATAK